MKKVVTLLFACLIFLAGHSQRSDLQIIITDSLFKSSLEAIIAQQPTQITIQGELSAKQWKKLLTTLPEDKSLRELNLLSNALEVLPIDLNKNYGVKNLVIRDNMDLDLDASTPSLESWKCLDKVALEVTEADELPNEWCSFSHLDLILCVHPEYPIEGSLDEVAAPFRKYSTFLADESMPGKRLNLEVISYLPKEIATASSSPIFYSEKIDTIACNKHYVSFSSPAPKLDVEKTVQVINNNQNQVIVYPESGTEILIPANAFMTKDGESIAGEVAIDYREFRNPLEFVMSGIPMSGIANNDPNSYFKSAGMFEINASINGEEVFLKPDKKVTINFESTDSQEAFPFWSFNDSTSTWENIGTSTLALQSPPREVRTAALDLYEINLNTSRWSNDTTRFQNRFESVKYRNIYPADQNIKGSRTKNCISFYNIRRTKEKQLVFSVNNLGFNREIGTIKTISFRLDDESYTRRKFNRKFSSKYSDINDARLVYENGHYSFRLKDGKKFIDVPVTPVKYDTKTRIATERDIALHYKRYQKILKRRADNFNRKILKKKNFLSVTRSTTKEEAYEAAKPAMLDWEKAMTYEEWLQHVDSIKIKELSLVNGLDATATNFTRRLSVANFGIYNCDQIQRLQSPIVVYANYQINNTPQDQCNQLYVVNVNQNMVLNYVHASYAYTPKNFGMDEYSDQILIHFNGEKISYYRYNANKAKFENNAPQTIELTPVPSGMSVAEMSTLIGL